MPESTITLTQSIVTGSIAGAAGVPLDHFFWAIQLRLQSGASFTLNPFILSRGLLTNAATVIPITAYQVGCNQYIKNTFFNTPELSNTQKIITTFFAGASSAVFCSPAELIMIHQAHSGYNFNRTCQYLISQAGYKCLANGLTATAAREGFFTFCFLGITPRLKKSIHPYCTNDYTAYLGSGFVSGIGASVLSQGIDTTKNIQQLELVSFKAAMKKIKKEQGIRGFWNGCIPRTIRITTGLTIMAWANEKMETTVNSRHHKIGRC